MTQYLDKKSTDIQVIASVCNEHQSFLNQYFKTTIFENNRVELTNQLNNNKFDLLFIDFYDLEFIKSTRLKYPQLKIIYLLKNETTQELKTLMQLPINTVDTTNKESLETLNYYIETIQVNKRTRNKIVSLEDKIIEFEKLLKVYGENVIASVTDTKGVIKYATQAFCDIGGYTKEDLIGHSHNIIRHEEMPKQIFQEMWSTLKSGQTWRGEIKNQKKDGGFYWVYATISPELDTDQNIIGYSAIRQNITDKKYIEELSITDSLTGLYNRRHYNETILSQLKVAQRYDLQLNFLLLDLDYFKIYNDTYGHHKGDEILIHFAQVIKKTFRRPDDFAFRLGGEEFGILFYSKGHNDVLKSANRLIKNLAKLKLEHKGNFASPHVTISGGIYCIKNGIDDKNSLFKYCDEALYKAKKSGRNQIIQYEEETFALK